METKGIVARVVAKKGKEQDVENFLKSALSLANAEPETIRWYALKFNHNTFGIFDTFPSEAGRTAHLSGEIANAIMANAEALLEQPPIIETVDLLAIK